MKKLLASLSGISEAEGVSVGINYDNVVQDDGPADPNFVEPNQSLRDNFRKYCQDAPSKYANLTCDHVAAIKLMKLLDDSGCSLSLFSNKIMDWHIENLA